jgi:glutaryl-CoA dehydrogenase
MSFLMNLMQGFARPKLKAKDAPDLGRFDWEDPFRLDDQLTEDERALRDAARAYAQDKLQPRVIQPMPRNRPTPPSSARWARWACWA